MRRAQVRKFLKNVGVGLEACGRTLIFRQEGDPIVDHVISENPAVLILGGLPEWGALSPKSLKGSPVTIHLYVEDVDAFVGHARKRCLVWSR